MLIFRLRAAYLGLLWVVETWRCAGEEVRLGNADCPYVCQCLLFAIPYKTVPSCLSHRILFHFGVSQDSCGAPWALSLQWDIFCQASFSSFLGMEYGETPNPNSWVQRGVFAVLHWENGLDFLHFQGECYGLGSFGALEVKIPSF